MQYSNSPMNGFVIYVIMYCICKYYITTCKAEAFFRIHNNPIKSRAGLQEPLTHKSVVVMTQLYVPTYLLLGNLSRDMNLLYIDTATFDGQLHQA